MLYIKNRNIKFKKKYKQIVKYLNIIIKYYFSINIPNII